MGSETCPQLQLLGVLGYELRALGLDPQMHSKIPGVAIPTATPGFTVWVFVTPSNDRLLCYVDKPRCYSADDPLSVARHIASYLSQARMP